ncbi:hypothetical protein [Agromyces agglutinans]|uniref:hypothetical protein n=1 Tax=Agromyces agglutinans TaxID=2662258 RepID=UPI001562ABC0|nr:hypothetical protein [Agromyces agglutinans]
MTAAERLVDLAAALSGDPTGRRREAWHAELAGAESRGLRRREVVFAAFRGAADVRRSAIRRLPAAAAAARRLRWSATALVIAALFAFAAFLGTGRPEEWAAFLRLLLLDAAAALGVLGAVGVAMGVSMLAKGDGRRPWMLVLAVLAAPILLGVLLVTGLSMLFAGGMLLGFVVLGVALAVPISSGPGARATWPGVPARLGQRTTGLLGAAVVLAATAAVALHVLVWNPQAKVPGVGLAEIYTTMAARGEPATWAARLVAVWAVGWVVLALVLAAAGIVGQRGILRRLDARRIARATLVALAGIGLTSWLAGFSMGMSLADAFATGGGDAAASGAVLIGIGILAGLAAAVRILPPPLRISA